MTELLSRHMNKKIEFQFNRQKAIEAILYFANARKQQKLTVLHLLKFLYYADMYHLNKYDRPVLGDCYYAMENGPVASNVYDMLKNSCNDYELSGWGRDSKVTALRDANLDYFSDTDIEAFDYVLNTFKQQTPDEMIKETHKTKAWINAWNNKNYFAKRSEMSYEDFYDTNVPPEKLEYLKTYSRLMVF